MLQRKSPMDSLNLGAEAPVDHPCAHPASLGQEWGVEPLGCSSSTDPPFYLHRKLG